jgi:hypothetical protein
MRRGLSTGADRSIGAAGSRSIHWLRLAAMWSALVAMMAVPAVAQAQVRRGVQNAAPDAAPGVSLAELQRLFDAYVLMQAQETLQLSDAQYPQFLARLRALQEVRRRTLVERTRIIQELRRIVQGRAEGAETGRLPERLKALREVEARGAAEIRQAADALDEVLEPLQQARWRILEEQMERRKLDLLMRARQNNRGRGAR